MVNIFGVRDRKHGPPGSPALSGPAGKKDDRGQQVKLEPPGRMEPRGVPLHFKQILMVLRRLSPTLVALILTKSEEKSS